MLILINFRSQCWFCIAIAFRKITKYQKSDDFFIFQISFQRFIREISHDVTIDQNFRF